jgi:hypothetical protein
MVNRFRRTTGAQLVTTLAAACAGCLGLSVASAQVGGQDTADNTTEVTLRFGTGHSDNILRRSSLEESGNYTALGALLDISRETTRVTAEVTGDLEFRSFSTSGIKDEPYGDFNARAELFAVPDRFSWVFEDQFGQGRVDPFNTIGPANQEQINIFATGPALYLPVGERNEVRLSSMIGQRTYGDSVGFDNDTMESTVGLFRQLSSTAEIGLNLESRDVEFDDSSLDNTIERAYVSYRKTLSNGAAAVEIGSNNVDFAGSNQSHPYFNLNWARDISTRTSVAFDVQSALYDSSDSFRGGQNFEDSLRTTDVYERKGGGASLIITPNRSRISLVARLSQDRYENDTTFDNDMTQLRFTYERTISARLDAGFDFNTVERDFTTSDQRDEDRRTSLYFERAFGRQLSLNVTYEHVSRGGVNTGTYDENSIRVMLLYALQRAAAGN